MINVLVKDENPETKNLLIKCLETAGFKIISKQNGLIRFQFADREFYTTTETKKSNTSRFLFPSIPRLHQVFDFIELNYHQNIGLKEVAQAVGYSSAYLTNLVRRLTGKTVNNWIIERRIAEARRLLLETDLSIERIAFDIGYQNMNHFYCQFRNYYKNTPGAWRETQRLVAYKQILN
ncbi:DNA-binding domain-containing protein, AraC-type [Rivularia sp. PCC 7116]|uniref:helix-turn-helix domain-containing protein n=1 Tax=Rivularia sp. PCC 7116 TaxID=373994 RepID=UPI00029EE8D7|nr:AraC family transcriptional regulator [Rivularia sp. PCC 7116]AFY53410.1 DNA-binding domain-containing protein, AraC-type [Rivularia sp. PCC 7116]